MRKAIEVLVAVLFAGASLYVFMEAALTPAREPTAALPALSLVWFLSIQLLAASYCSRFGGRPADYLWTGACLGFLCVLPLLPLFLMTSTSERVPLLWTLVFGPLGALVLGKVLHAQGRYFYTEREMPELSGEARSVVNAILLEAGLRPLSVRVAPHLPTFNAMVQGLRTCVVLIDERTATSLSTAELRALMAHEAGHVRLGGVFPYLCVFSLALAFANLAAVRSNEGGLGLFILVGTLFLCGPLLSQTLELSCDRFAARLTSPGEVACMLRKVYADLPRSMGRLVENPLLSSMMTHPSPEVRLAALGQGPAFRRWIHRGGQAVILVIFLAALASSAGLFRTLDLPLPRALETAIAVSLTGLLVLAVLARLLILREARASFGIALGSAARSSKLRRALLASGVLGMAGLVAFTLLPDLLTPAVPFLSALVLFVFLVLFSLAITGKQRSGSLFRRPARVRRAVGLAFAAVSEKRPQEGVAAAEAVLARHPADPWLLTARAMCQSLLGRLEEARADLQQALAGVRKFPLALYYLAAVELLRQNGEEAAELAASLTALTPRDPLAWNLRGLVSLVLGKAEPAGDAYGRAHLLREKDASALAGMALASLERSGGGAEVDAWISAARQVEPRHPLVLTADARRHRVQGQVAEARHLFQEAEESLRAMGFQAWVPLYQDLARRWGLIGSDHAAR